VLARQHQWQPKSGGVVRGMKLTDGTDPKRAKITSTATEAAKAATAKIENEQNSDEEADVGTMPGVVLAAVVATTAVGCSGDERRGHMIGHGVDVAAPSASGSKDITPLPSDGELEEEDLYENVLLMGIGCTASADEADAGGQSDELDDGDVGDGGGAADEGGSGKEEDTD